MLVPLPVISQDNYYFTYPITLYYLSSLGQREPSTKNKREHISPLQHRPLESILLPKPDITGGLCEHCTLHLQTCPSAVPSCPNHFFKKLKLSDKISSSTTYAQNVLGESHLHLAPPPLQSPAHARARSPHTSLRRIFSSRPQSPFRHTMHLRANYITASRSSTDKTIEFVGPQPHQAHCHLHARQQITGPVTLP
jgi:hypothetical protein